LRCPLSRRVGGRRAWLLGRRERRWGRRRRRSGVRLGVVVAGLAFAGRSLLVRRMGMVVVRLVVMVCTLGCRLLGGTVRVVRLDNRRRLACACLRRRHVAELVAGLAVALALAAAVVLLELVVLMLLRR